MRIRLLIFLLLITCGQLRSQTTFRKEFFTTPSVFTTRVMDCSVIQTLSSEFVFTGICNGKAVLAKTDHHGAFLWQKEFTTNNITSASTVIEAGNSFYIFGVAIDSIGSNQYCILKTDTNGSLIWTKHYELPGNLYLQCESYNTWSNVGLGNNYGVKAKAIGEDKIVFAGFVNDASSVSLYTQVILIDSSGNVQWTRQVPGTKIKGFDIEVHPDPTEFGNEKIYVLSDNAYSSSMTEYDINGNTIWSKFYSGVTAVLGTVHFTTDNSLVIVGRMTGSTADELFIMKTDTAGVPIWAKSYQFGIMAWGNKAASTPSGGVVVAGGRILSASSTVEAMLIEVDALGNIAWSNIYPHFTYPDSDFLSVTQCSDQGIAALGTCGATSSQMKFYFIKTDYLGNSNCNDIGIIPVVSNKIISVSTEQPAPNFALTVVNQNLSTTNYTLADSVICLQTSIQEAQSNEQITISPNPSNGRIKIGRQTEALSYEVIGVNGKIVHSDKLGREEYLLDLSFLTDGVYILRLNYTNSASSQPLIITH